MINLGRTHSLEPNVSEDYVPLSFPAILRNPGIHNRLGQLAQHDSNDQRQPLVPTKARKTEIEGKRWIRRKENDHFVGNPHVVLASHTDHPPLPPAVRSTFPQPLPSYISRSMQAPSGALPTRNPTTANAGRFSLSLKGMRRELRKSGVRAELLVRDVEDELIDWLREGGSVLFPDRQDPTAFSDPGVPVRSTETIKEVFRSPIQLVWSIGDDPFARYVVHCVARYHEIVSFSKDVASRRLTYLLRPTVTRPDSLTLTCLDTPPITDLDSSAHSDLSSDRDIDSDVEHPMAHALHPISEESDFPFLPSSVIHSGPNLRDHDQHATALDDVGAEGDESESDHGLAASADSLSIQESVQNTPSYSVRQRTRRAWHPSRTRSSSSPSRSSGQTRRLTRLCSDHARRRIASPISFYDYLFSQSHR